MIKCGKDAASPLSFRDRLPIAGGGPRCRCAARWKQHALIEPADSDQHRAVSGRHPAPGPAWSDEIANMARPSLVPARAHPDGAIGTGGLG